MNPRIALMAGVLVCSTATADVLPPPHPAADEQRPAGISHRRRGVGKRSKHGSTLPSTTLLKDPRDPTGTMIPDRPAMPGAVPDRAPNLPKQPGMPPDPTDPGHE